MFSFVQLCRPKDWIKNIFLFAPLFFTPHLFHFAQISRVFIGAVLFSIVASSIYILNDLKDAAADRLHPVKKYRPMASKKISIFAAHTFCLILSLIGLIGSACLSTSFFIIIITYYVINVAYSYGLKRIAIIDIYCIAAGFILRVMSGAALIYVTPSIWILICIGLLALFLAIGKRRDDLVNNISASHRDSIRGYNIIFIDMSMIIILSALLIAYTIYSTLNLPAVNFGAIHFYWTVPVVLLGILRYLQIILVEEKSGSPTALLLSDRFLYCTVIAWIILSAILIY